MSQSKPMAADHLATTTLSTLPTTSLGPFSLSLLFLDIHRLGSGGAKLSYAVMKKKPKRSCMIYDGAAQCRRVALKLLLFLFQRSARPPLRETWPLFLFCSIHNRNTRPCDTVVVYEIGKVVV